MVSGGLQLWWPGTLVATHGLVVGPGSAGSGPPEESWAIAADAAVPHRRQSCICRPPASGRLTQRDGSALRGRGLRSVIGT